MEPLKIEITLDRDGTIILAGGDLELVVGRDQGVELWYTPAKWRLIMAVIKALPEPIFKRLNI